MKSILKINWVLVFFTSLLLFSCTTYKNVVKPSAQGKNSGIPLEKLRPGDKLKITKKDDSKIRMIFDKMEDGHIVGIIQRDSGASGNFDHYSSSISLQEIKTIELKKFSLGKTVALPIATVAIAFILYFMAWGGAFS
ncbi:hypothetical protein [Aquiflexum sp.]|uniref:hypothetical protein n=1 Tax=Aquiflexum sp. TaxID=1872584 RepID=UPI003592F920